MASRDYSVGRAGLQEGKGGDPQGGGERAAHQDRRAREEGGRPMAFGLSRPEWGRRCPGRRRGPPRSVRPQGGGGGLRDELARRGQGGGRPRRVTRRQGGGEAPDQVQAFSAWNGGGDAREEERHRRGSQALGGGAGSGWLGAAGPGRRRGPAASTRRPGRREGTRWGWAFWPGMGAAMPGRRIGTAAVPDAREEERRPIRVDLRGPCRGGGAQGGGGASPLSPEVPGRRRGPRAKSYLP